MNYLHLLYLVFFNKLFAVAAQYLLKMSPEKTYEDEAELALAWREHLENDDDVRKQFLHHVVTVSVMNLCNGIQLIDCD